MQVIETPCWIKNVEVCERTLSRAEHVGETETLFVPVPWPDRRYSEIGCMDAFCEPNHQGRIDIPDEWRGAFDRCLLSRGRVSEPEKLLQIAEANLDSPALRIRLQDFSNRQVGVRRKEHADGNASMVDTDNDDAEQPRAAGAVPLGGDHFVIDRPSFSVDISCAALPLMPLVASESLGFGQYLPSHARSSTSFRPSRFRGLRSEYGVWPHRADDLDVCREVMKDGAIAVRGVHDQTNRPPFGPFQEYIEHLARELGLLTIRTPFGFALLLIPVEAEENWKRPRSSREWDTNNDRKRYPYMAEAKYTERLCRPDGIEVATDPEHVGALLGGQRIVDCDPDRRVVRDEPDESIEEQQTDVVGVPGTPREEPMERFVVAAACNVGGHQRLCNGVRAVRQDPPCEDYQRILEARSGERGPEPLEYTQKCDQRLRYHGSILGRHVDRETCSAHSIERPIPPRDESTTLPAMARLIRTPLASSSIASITYDPNDGLLEIEYRRTGQIYDYFDVPRDIYRALMDAESKGAFINRFLKPNYDYARVDFPL